MSAAFLRTIRSVELSAALIVAGFVGAVVGAAITYVWRFSERQYEVAAVQEPQFPAGADAVLSVLSSSAVLLDSSDTVVKASAPAHALGLIQGAVSYTHLRAHETVLELVCRLLLEKKNQ